MHQIQIFFKIFQNSSHQWDKNFSLKFHQCAHIVNKNSKIESIF